MSRRERRNRRLQERGSKLDLGDRFRVVGPLGDGGLGTVLKVEDTSINELRAVKVLNPLFSRDYSKKMGFEREIKIIENLNHPNIVTVFGYGEARNGSPFMVMEFIRGITLEERLKEKKQLTVEEAIPIFIAIAEAVESAHVQGIIHRDLKPNNIMLIDNPEGGPPSVKVVDFSISRLRQEGVHRTTNLTQNGEIFGSPFYMSPEQCQAEEIDKRSDIYSFGCLMYETLTGKPPFHGSNPVNIVMQHLAAKPKPFSRTNIDNKVPPIVELVVMQCLEKYPHLRFQSMTELKNALINAKDPHATIGKSVKVIFGPTVVILILLLFIEMLLLAHSTGKGRALINSFTGIYKKYPIISKDPNYAGGERTLYEADGARNLDEAFMIAVKKEVPLFGAQLTGVDLRGKRIVGAVLNSVNLNRADLSGSEFIDCQMHDCLLQDCTAIGATFTRCQFTGGKFESCDFSYSRFELCDKPSAMNNCKLTGASINGVIEQ